LEHPQLLSSDALAPVNYAPIKARAQSIEIILEHATPPFGGLRYGETSIHPTRD